VQDLVEAPEAYLLERRPVEAEEDEVAPARLDLLVRGHEGSQYLAVECGHASAIDDAALGSRQRLFELGG